MVKKVLVYPEYGKQDYVLIPRRSFFRGASGFCKVNPFCPEWIRVAVSELVEEEKLV